MTRLIPHRSRLAREERGQGMVEFALILPVFVLLLVGMIEFGSIYSKVISMRQGVREAGRQASVAVWGPGPPAPCPLTFSGPAPSADIQRLLCLTKDQAGVGDVVKVRVRFTNPDLTKVTELNRDVAQDASNPPGYCGGPSGPCLVGNAILVCAIYPLQSLTGLFQPFLDHPPRYAKTKAAFRIENLSATPLAELGGGEADPSGGNWSWCTA